ncbi:retrotransposon-related protein [Trifolium pratense]|uniref:Retrotransposon-related protein n=1 Tax=Trifolium pratense TaxID=57577 RepID=A0A2K3NUY8_TRIPR|nr:retrotransposon-related protein [Trifolium pratense]
MGQPKPIPAEASLHQFKRLFSTNALDTLLHLQPITQTEPNNQAQTHDPAITNLITKFSYLFTEPTSLPPPRPTDHQIPLLHNSDPVSIRPYRYPQFQKREIELQIQQMLSQGIIRPSSSAFSSPTLKMLGQIHKQNLQVLIDSGSTHNFIQDHVAKSLGLILEPTQAFQVLVGNGEELNCYSMSCQTPPLPG